VLLTQVVKTAVRHELKRHCPGGNFRHHVAIYVNGASACSRSISGWEGMCSAIE
jgi:hypothetical protein